MIDKLRTLVGDAIALRDSHMPEQLAEQLGGLHYVRMLRSILGDLEYELETKTLEGKDPAQLLESRGWVGEIRDASDRKEWKKEELQAAVRRMILSACETPAEALDMLMNMDEGLQPLNMGMRITVLREYYGLNPDEFCTTTPRQKVLVIKWPTG